MFSNYSKSQGKVFKFVKRRLQANRGIRQDEGSADCLERRRCSGCFWLPDRRSVVLHRGEVLG